MRSTLELLLPAALLFAGCGGRAAGVSDARNVSDEDSGSDATVSAVDGGCWVDSDCAASWRCFVTSTDPDAGGGCHVPALPISSVICVIGGTGDDLVEVTHVFWSDAFGGGAGCLVGERADAGLASPGEYCNSSTPVLCAETCCPWGSYFMSASACLNNVCLGHADTCYYAKTCH